MCRLSLEGCEAAICSSDDGGLGSLCQACQGHYCKHDPWYMNDAHLGD